MDVGKRKCFRVGAEEVVRRNGEGSGGGCAVLLWVLEGK